MDKADLIESFCFAGLRLLAFSLVLAGALRLLFAVLDVWYRFDPNYLGAFLGAHFLRPAILLLVGLVLYPSTPALARRMAKGKTQQHK